MYKYIFILLLAGCAAPQWVVHGTNDTYKYYIEEPVTVTATGRILVRELADFSAPQDGVRSIEGQAEYDCTGYKRINKETFFSGNMAEGDVLQSSDTPTEWVAVTGMNRDIMAKTCLYALNQADKIAAQRQQLQLLYMGTGVMRNITTMTNNYGTGFATGQP